MLAARKERARRQDERRRWIEKRLAKKKDWSEKDLWDELGLWIPPPEPPAQQFIIDRMMGKTGNTLDVLHRAMVELLRSDVALDQTTRSWAADMLWRLAFPNPAEEARQKKRLEAAWADQLKRHLQKRGATAAEAEQLVAESLGVSVDALRRRRQRSKL